jgi:predicted transcriptional regulator
MVEEYLKYIDKADCERRGLERTADGKYYKRNTLERYEAKGYLDGGKYDSQQLLAAGMRLSADFYKARIIDLSANDLTRIRVDSSRRGMENEFVVSAQQRFNQACRAVPYEFWGVVSRVCCDDQDLIGEIDNSSKRQRQYQKGAILLLLKMGLARLVEHYRD